MQKLTAVEEARALFTEGSRWSVLKWLSEKRRVRAAADRATSALDACENGIKAQWSDDLKRAYAELAPLSADDEDDLFASAEREFAAANARPVAEAIREIARRVKQADDVAHTARMTAEETFALAERRLSIALTKRGAGEAIRSYDLSYKAIEEAEAALAVAPTPRAR
jgi:hypothetical protein